MKRRKMVCRSLFGVGLSFLLLLLACQAEQTVPKQPKAVKGSAYKPVDVEGLPPTAVQVQQRANYLVKSPEVNNYFSIDEQGISMYASPADKRADRPECRIYYQEVPMFKKMFYLLGYENFIKYYQQKGSKRLNVDYLRRYPSKSPIIPKLTDKKQPLKGVRIAINPGHVGGSLEEAKLEWRYVTISGHEEIAFYESALNWATGKFLEQMLVKQGAEVLLTRKAHGLTVFDKSYRQWLQEDKEAALLQAVDQGRLSPERAEYFRKMTNEEKFFHDFFARYELEARAQKINDFRPHITVVIHYNAEARRRIDRHGHLIPTPRNYTMVFTPGSFMKSELADVQSRAAFLRLLISEDLDESIEFSAHVQANFTKVLKVRAVSENDNLSYLNGASIPTPYEGVWARNLVLTRLIAGTLCYGETFCQENLEEAKRLNKRDIEVGGLKTSSRTREVAKAYFRAIMIYVNASRKKVAK